MPFPLLGIPFPSYWLVNFLLILVDLALCHFLREAFLDFCPPIWITPHQRGLAAVETEMRYLRSGNKSPLSSRATITSHVSCQSPKF